MENLGRIDMKKLLEAARRAGISAEELRRELERRKLAGLVFSSGK